MPYSLLEIARAALDAGEIEEALAALDERLADVPDDADALRLRAAIFARLPGRVTDALMDLVSISEQTVDDRRLLARLLIETHNLKRALMTLESLWGMFQDPLDAEMLLRVLLDEGLPERALQFLDALPDIWTWRVWRGDAYAALGDTEAAIAWYGAALEDVPDTDLTAPLKEYLRDRIANLS